MSARVAATLRRSLLLLVLFAPALLALSFASDQGATKEWPVDGFAEPSGIVHHTGRDTLFIVGDEGDIGEVSLDGRLLRQARLGGDLEGIATDPATGLLYVAREGQDILLEVRPDDFKILRRFTIDRAFGGDPNFLQRGGDGIEGVTFVPDPSHPEGGTLWVVNQFDPPVLIELSVPLRTSKEKFEVARIVRAIPVDGAPLSGLTWVAERREFLIPSALWKRVYVTDADGRLQRSVRIPGFMPEGVTSLPDGRVIIAQDSGGLLEWSPPSDPFAGEKEVGPPLPPTAP